MKASITRRGFLLGTASAAVLAGLAGCTVGSDAPKKEVSTSQAGAITADTEYYKSAYAYTAEAEQQLYDDQVALFKQIVHEGIALLKNEGSALPLSADDGKVTAFGNAGPAMMSGLDASMKEAGFDFDDAAWEFYGAGSKNVKSWQVNENAWPDVTSADFFQGVGGVAIVFLGRRDNEGCDAQWYEDHDYLALSQEEKDMLNGVAELRRAGTFSKMIVAVTTSNTISWEDGAWSDAIDALLWFGNITATGYSSPLAYGVPAFVEVLNGTANPSGRLADTIYKDNHLNPVMVNFGRIDADLSRVSDAKLAEVQAESDKWQPDQFYGNHWRHNYVYAEGIYMGYRYPETRYEDKVLGQGNAGDFDYASYVAYPFGSGLSYTSFSYSNFSVEENDDAFELRVTVTNDGSVAGKHAALAYVQCPYTDYDRENGVEKAAIELKGYEKTQLLEPGASEDLSINVSKRELASFDANAAKTYILEDGDYYFTVAGSSHEAVNNVLAAKGKTTSDGMTDEGDASVVWVWSNPDFDSETFSVSAVTGNKISNLLDDVDPNKNPKMADENNVVWLSRSDWQATLPTKPVQLVYTDEVVEMAKPISYQAGSGDADSVVKHEFGKTDSDLKLVDLMGKDYDDDDWEKLLSKLSYEEMVSLVVDPEQEFSKIGKPATVAGNGSQGWGTQLAAVGLSGMQWPSKETVAATFNTEVHEGVGAMTGENLLHSATVESKNVSLYGWSCNAHRSPYSGRNFEYFSEDPYLGGRACAEETRGIVAKGGLVYTKHCAGNDQEEYRHGVPSWANEQTLREIYLRQFEKAIVEGKANGIMTGFNRLGMTWTGENRAMLIDWLEGELGYKGTTITDQFESSCMDAPDGLLNGTHVWLGAARIGHNDVCNSVLLQDDYKNDPVIQDALFGAVHRALYNFANSLAMNGLTHEYEFVGDHPLVTSYSNGGKDAATAPTSFYGDKTYVAVKSGWPSSTTVKGTWDYSEDAGLTLTADDGTAIEVSSDNGLLNWEIPVAGMVAPNTISQYEIVSAYNDYFEKSFDAGEKPVYALTFAAGNDAVSGSDPNELKISRGEAVKLPDCPYEGEHLVFDGWSIDGKVYPAGSDYAPAAYADVTAEGSWSVKVLATATTRDGYYFSTVQPEGVSLALYADGTLEADHYKGYVCKGAWEVAGSGSGTATLTLLNEAGSAIALKVGNDEATYTHEGVYYDWNQPNQGLGSGVFMIELDHTLDLGAFLSAYNEEFGTSYDSVTAESGVAELELVESGEPKSTF